MRSDERAGSAVVPVVERDVVVDVDLRSFPVAALEAQRRQRLHGWTVDALERRASATLELLERAGVEALEQLAERCVELGKAEERPVAKRGQQPALGDLHAHLDLGLVPSLSGAGRDHGDPVVLGHFEVRGVDVRSYRSGPVTAARSWSGTMISGVHPKYSKARTVASMKSGALCVAVASAYV
ncbi:MAG: hypothetical protein IPM35_05985 [Myxococcales bacterium]|nr:hypothetical protein [Myxococcales bacterium]